MNTEVMFSSKSDEWSTPQNIFDHLNAEFDFNLDPCATEENHKCDTFFTQNDDGSRVLVDKDNPRTEIIITKMEK